MYNIETPIISVIVPIYNTGPYLEDCISSVLSQSFSNFELILINDGSTDNSKEICDRVCEEDGRIRVISYKNNMGVSYARNKGIDSAIGKYLFFLDSDDLIHPKLFEEGLRQAEASGADMVMFHLLFSDKNFMINWRDFCSKPLASKWVTLTGENLWSTWFTLMDRSYIGGKLFLRDAVRNLHFEESICRFEDGLYIYAFLANNPRKILYTDSPGYYYRIRGDSLCHTQQLDELLDGLRLRRNVIEQELQANREENAVLEEQVYMSIIRNWYAENERDDKTSEAAVKKLVEEEKQNSLYKKISGREKRRLFLAMHFPSVYNALTSAQKRLSRKL